MARRYENNLKSDFNFYTNFHCVKYLYKMFNVIFFFLISVKLVDVCTNKRTNMNCLRVEMIIIE